MRHRAMNINIRTSMTCAHCSETTQLNSTQRASMDAGVKYLSVHIYLVTSVYQVLQST